MEPYRGLQPYTEEYEEFFFGRDAERAILIDKILSDKLTLLFSATGVGKSSLLQAAVMPELKRPARENLDVVYYNDWVTPPLTGLKQKILAVLQERGKIAADFQFPSWDLSACNVQAEGPGVGDSPFEGGQGGVSPSSFPSWEGPGVGDSPLEGDQGGVSPGVGSLKQFLHIGATFASEPLVIILDQFEEFFQYQCYAETFTPFIEQLSEAIRDRETPVAFLISMREDFALNLNAFKEYLPTTLFENYFRLEKLEIKEAEKAIRKPVEKVGFRYEEGLLEDLLKDLADQERESRIGSRKEIIPDHAPSFVEPPNVQIVCTQLWDMEKENPDKVICTETYNEKGGSKGFINSYFTKVITNFSRSEKKLASKAFDHLVTPSGTKIAYPIKDLSEILKIDEKVLEPVLTKLAAPSIRVLRSQNREGVIWYELYHDAFSNIINTWNRNYKTQPIKRFLRAGIAVVIFFFLFVAYNIFTNFTNYHLRLSEKGISNQIELYRGKVDSWDIVHLKKYKAETPYTRSQIELDKQFIEKPISDYDNLNRALIGELPIVRRISAYWKTGEIDKALELADKSISKDDIPQTQAVIKFLANFRSQKSFELLKKHLLSSKDGDIQISIISAIRSTHFTWITETLITLLDDQDSNVRDSAFEFLVELGASSKVIEPLIEHLKNQDKEMRQIAATALGLFGNHKAVEQLMELLKDQEQEVRQSAAWALGQLGNREVVESLVDLLRDQNSDKISKISGVNALYQLSSNSEVLNLLRSDEVVELLITFLTDWEGSGLPHKMFPRAWERVFYPTGDNTISLLVRIGSDKMLEVLRELLRDQNPDIRAKAVRIIRQLDGDSNKTLELLQGLLRDQNPDIRAKAVRIISQFDADNVMGPALELLEDRNSDVRSAVAEILGRLDGEKVVEPLVKLLKDQDEDVRRNAAKSLVQLKSRKVIGLLVKLLKDKDSEVRKSAVEVLGELKSDEIVDQLVELLKDEDLYVRLSAIKALGKIGRDEAFNPLVELLENQNSDVRRIAAVALGQLGNSNAVGLLKELLTDPDPEVRKSAAIALGQLGSNKAEELLVSLAMDEDQNSDIRQSAEDALAGLGSIKALRLWVKLLEGVFYYRGRAEKALERIDLAEAEEPLLDLLQDQDSDVRKGAAELLGQIGSDKAVEHLVELLKDKDPFVQGKAIKILGQLGSSKALNLLYKLLMDQDRHVRGNAAAALVLLGSGKAISLLLELLNEPHYWPNWVNSAKISMATPPSFAWSSAVEKLGEIGSVQAVQPLVKLLENFQQDVYMGEGAAVQDSYMSVHATVALGQLYSSEATSPLLKMLKYPSWSGWENVAKSLGQLGIDEAINPLLETLKNQEEYISPEPYYMTNVWGTVAEVLGELGDRKAINSLIKLLNNQNASMNTKYKAAIALRKLSAHETAIIQLKDLYQKEYHPNLGDMSETQFKLAVAAALLSLGQKEMMTFLWEKSESKNVEERKEVAVALGETPSEQGIALLIALLADENPDVKIQTITSLGRAQAVSVVPHLHKLSEDPNPKMREAIVNALGEIASPESVDHLKKVVLDTEERITIRIAAIQGLGEISTEEAVAALLEVLDKTIEHYHFKTVIALGEIRSKQALQKLLELLRKQEQRKSQWRKIRDENIDGYLDGQIEEWRKRLEEVEPQTYMEFELAHAIAQIDPNGEGVKLLSHDLAKVREGAWMGLARLPLTKTRPFYLTEGPAAIALIERLDRERMQSKNPLFRHAAYRAIDGMLIAIEAYGSKPDLKALEDFLPKGQDQEGVLTRVEWTIDRLQEREEDKE